MFTSYFKFLSRNKVYTTINVLGLALSFMFMLLIGCYIWQETHKDAQHHLRDRIYQYVVNLNGECLSGGHWHMQKIFHDAFPELGTSCALINYKQCLRHNGEEVETSLYYTDADFFEMFDFELVRGDRHHVFDDPYSMVITEDYGHIYGAGKTP